MNRMTSASGGNLGGETPPLPLGCVIGWVTMGIKYDPRIHHRRSIRLPGYDYSQEGAYFLTLCAQGRECLFGDIQDDRVQLSAYGSIVMQSWQQLPLRFNTIDLDEVVIMPNHFHGIVIIHGGAEATSVANGAVTNSEDVGGGISSQREKPKLGQIVAYFKYQTTKWVNEKRGTPGQKVWQRNYYEHIIRNESSLDHLRHYIHHNPQQWAVDQLHPQVPSKW